MLKEVLAAHIAPICFRAEAQSAADAGNNE